MINLSIFSQSSFFVFSLLLANFCNFAFNAYLGRKLSFEDFGLVTIVVTIWNLVIIFLGALAMTVNHRVAFLYTREGNQASSGFIRYLLKRMLVFISIVSFLWIIIVPFLGYFFHVSPVVLWHITPSLFLGAFLFAIRGYFAGVSAFGIAGFFVAIEALVKLLLGIIFSHSSLYAYTYVAIPLSIGISFVISLMFFYRVLIGRKYVTESYGFPRRFFFASLISGLSITIFLSFDVLLAKHYLDPVSAGQYAFLSLVGKMIFFFGSLLNGFVVTYVSNDIAHNRDPQKIFYKFLMFVLILSFFAFVTIGVFGRFTLPILFGEKVFVILPYLVEYALGIMLYTISSFIVLYHLARNHYSLSFVPVLSSLLFVFGVFFFHSDISSITHILFLVSAIHFFLASLIHVLQRNGRFILRNLVDLLDIFSPQRREMEIDKGKKRILIMNWRDTRHVYSGGAEVYIHELAKRWVKDGHKVTLFCGNDSMSPRNEWIDGIEVIRRGGFYFVYLWAFLYYVKKFRGKFDIIIDCHNGIPFFTPLYAKERIICIVHHVHEEVFRAYLSPPFALLARVLENRCMPMVYKDIRFITVSPSTKDEMIRWGIIGKGIAVIPSGIDRAQYKPGKKSKDPLIIYVGRLKQYKSVDVFIKAAKNIYDRFPSARFVIAGDGDDKKRLVNLVHRLQASSYITFTGKVSEEEKISLYQRAWVCVHPSRMEGWGITIIESNACGTPVVASNVPGLKDSVIDGKTGILVPYGDVDAFSNAISKLIVKKTYRKNMERACIEWAKQFDWDKTASAFLNCIDTVISESSSREQARNEQRAIISLSKRSPAFSEVEAG